MEALKGSEDIDFQKYWQILKRHRAPSLKVFLGVVIIAFFAALLSEKEYSAYGKLKFNKQNATSSLITENKNSFGTLETLSNTATPVDTEAEVVRSAPVVRTVIEQLDLTEDEGERIDYQDFLENLGVSNIPGTDVLTVSYRSREKEEAEKVVNALMQAYLNQNIGINRTKAQAARTFINKQLPQAEAILLSAEEDLKFFKQQHNIVNLDVETELAANKIGLIEEQIDLAQVNLAKVNSRIEGIKSKLNIDSEEAINLNRINDSPAIQQIVIKLREAEDQLALERSRFRDNSPVIINLKSQKAELEKELQRRTKNSINLNQVRTRKNFQTGDIQKDLAQELVSSEILKQSLIRELKSLERLKKSSREKNNLVPQVQQRYRDLQRKAEVAQSAYKTLVVNLQKAQIAENQSVNNAQIISNAIVGKYPVSTSKKLIVLGGIGLGSILYIIVAFLAELKDPSFKTSGDLHKTFDYKLLTTIPNLEEKGLLGKNRPLAIQPELHTTDDPFSLVSEAYKMLYSNLQFLADDEDIKVVTITSSIPKEGKSTVSANLAGMISQLNKRVLLIDADLHKPRQHSIWNTKNQDGLIEVLQNKIPLSEAIQPVDINPKLSILTAGSMQTEYLSLLKSHRMTELLEECRGKYDLVVIDTPPVLLFSDTLVVGRKTDGIVLVGRLGVTNPTISNSAKDLLEQSGQKILGVVINGVDREVDGYYRYSRNYELKLQYQDRSLPSSTSY